MTPDQVLHAAIVRDPTDDLAWLALADRLEETGQERRGELLRLTRTLHAMGHEDTRREATETRLCVLLLSGAEPCLPEFANSVSMRFVLIPPGRFRFGRAGAEAAIASPVWPAGAPA